MIECLFRYISMPEKNADEFYLFFHFMKNFCSSSIYQHHRDGAALLQYYSTNLIVTQAHTIRSAFWCNRFCRIFIFREISFFFFKSWRDSFRKSNLFHSISFFPCSKWVFSSKVINGVNWSWLYKILHPMLSSHLIFFLLFQFHSISPP